MYMDLCIYVYMHIICRMVCRGTARCRVAPSGARPRKRAGPQAGTVVLFGRPRGRRGGDGLPNPKSGLAATVTRIDTIMMPSLRN